MTRSRSARLSEIVAGKTSMNLLLAHGEMGFGSSSIDFVRI
jgi:hypothetical protein